jgi:hypothetical protein
MTRGNNRDSLTERNTKDFQVFYCALIGLLVEDPIYAAGLLVTVLLGSPVAAQWSEPLKLSEFVGCGP